MQISPAFSPLKPEWNANYHDQNPRVLNQQVEAWNRGVLESLQGEYLANRAQDWLDQADHDLQHARNAKEDGDYDWACFAAHQSAEKAAKGLFLALGGEAWGHSLTKIIEDLHNKLSVPDELKSCARQLDKHYIPTRYPNGFDAGAPHDYYTEGEAQKAIVDAKRIYDFCHQSIHRRQSGD